MSSAKEPGPRSQAPPSSLRQSTISVQERQFGDCGCEQGGGPEGPRESGGGTRISVAADRASGKRQNARTDRVVECLT